MTFGFIPLSDPVLPVNHICQPNLNCSVVELHSKIKEQYSPTSLVLGYQWLILSLSTHM